MIERIKRIYLAIIHSGVSDEKDYGEIRKIKFLNFTCFISSSIAFISGLISFVQLQISVGIFYVFWGFFLMIFVYLNKVNRSLLARVAFLSIALVYEWYSVHHLNRFDFREYYLILDILVSFILFDSMLLSSVLFIGLVTIFYGPPSLSTDFFPKTLRLSAFFIVSAFLKSVILKVEEVIKIKSREAAEAENARLREQQEKVKAELTHKNTELVNFAVQITQKNEFIESLKEKVKQHKMEGLDEIIQANESITKDREEFETYVQHVCEGFFAKLSELYPEITSSEKRLAALLRLDLSSKEISTVLSISPKSVDMSRYRLRKKMNLDASANLSEALQSI